MKINYDCIDSRGNITRVYRQNVCFGAIWQDLKGHAAYRIYMPLQGNGTYCGTESGREDKDKTYSLEELEKLTAAFNRAGIRCSFESAHEIQTSRDPYSAVMYGPKLKAAAFYISTEGQSEAAVMLFLNAIRLYGEAAYEHLGKVFNRYCEETSEEPILNRLILAHYNVAYGCQHVMRPSDGRTLLELHDDAWYNKNILASTKHVTSTLQYMTSTNRAEVRVAALVKFAQTGVTHMELAARYRDLYEGKNLTPIVPKFAVGDKVKWGGYMALVTEVRVRAGEEESPSYRVKITTPGLYHDKTFDAEEYQMRLIKEADGPPKLQLARDEHGRFIRVPAFPARRA